MAQDSMPSLFEVLCGCRRTGIMFIYSINSGRETGLWGCRSEQDDLGHCPVERGDSKRGCL